MSLLLLGAGPSPDGGGGGGSTDNLDTATASADLVLTNTLANPLTASHAGGGSINPGIARSINPVITDGTRYFEVTVSSPASYALAVGLVNGTAALSGANAFLGFDANSIGWTFDGTVAGSASGSTGGYADTNTIGVKVTKSGSTQTVVFVDNSGTVSGSFTAPSGSVFAAISVSGLSSSVVLNFGGSAYVHAAAAAGASNWP